jgi:phospholipase D1/2
VASKVRAGEPFAAYVVLPMWPEGNPGSGPAQEILFWQNQTMEMMYSVVAAALEGKGGHPQEHLNFYCLGNREPAEDAGDGNKWAPADPLDDATTSSAAVRDCHCSGPRRSSFIQSFH